MKTIRLRPFDAPLAVFLASAVIGSWVVYDPALSHRTLIVLVGMVGLYLFLSRVATTERRWDTFAAVLVGVSALVSFYFITQAGHIQYDEKVEAISRLARWISALFPTAVFWQPVTNSLATFLESSLFLAFGLALVQKQRARQIAAWMAVGLIAIALLLAASRGAWLAVLATALLWAAMHWKPARWLAFLTASGMIGLVLFVLIRGDLNVLLEIPVVGNLAGALFIRPDRLEVYRHSLALLAEQPFTGIGLGNAFSLVYSRYELLLTVPFLGYSHNLLLEVWLQQGIIGAAAFIWLVTSLYAKVLLGYNAFRADIRLQAATAGLTATLLHGLSDARQYPSLWTWLPFFFLLGLCAASLVRMQPRSLRSGWLLPGGIATVLLLLVLLLRWPPQAAWDANRAALLQTRADLNGALSSNQRTTMRIESEALFRRALNADPDSVQINRRFGLLLLEEGRYEEAIPHLVIAYQNTPQHLATQKGLGLAYLWNGELEKAAMLLAGLPGITEELQGLAWQEYNDFHHYQTAIYAYQLLDHLQPGQSSNQEMIRILQEKLGAP